MERGTMEGVIKKRRTENEEPLTFVLVEPINQRIYPDGTEYGVCSAITSQKLYKSIQKMIIPDTHLKTIKLDTAYITSKYTLMTDSIKIAPKSILFETKLPVYNTKIVEEYLNPTEVDVTTALSLPSGQRVSVTGYVTKVSNVITSPSSRRKVITLGKEPAGGDACDTLEIKLWGNLTSMPVDTSPELIVICCVEINEYNNRKSANSTVNTKIKSLDKEKILEGEVGGAHIDIMESHILMEHKAFQISYENIHKIFPENVFRPGKTIVATFKGNTITSVSSVTDLEALD